MLYSLNIITLYLKLRLLKVKDDIMIYIPRYVERIINKLENHGYEAFIVGGSLRDIMLEKEPNDFDITTNAKPDKIEEIFWEFKTVNIGKEFGTIIVVQEE